MEPLEQRLAQFLGTGTTHTGYFFVIVENTQRPCIGRTGLFFVIDFLFFFQVGLAMVSFVALGLGMPIGNAVGNCVHKRTLKSGIALLLAVLGSYSLVYFVVNSQ